MVTRHSGVLSEEDFSFLDVSSRDRDGRPLLGHASLAELERCALQATLSRTGGNVKEAAAVLGVDRSTIYGKMRKYGIER
ncbi:MAG: helix-turn-helix domain-containing protein [Polyangia bacterium]